MSTFPRHDATASRICLPRFGRNKAPRIYRGAARLR